MTIEETRHVKPGLRNTLRRRGIYLLPNLFTLGCLFSGFFAIVQAMNGAWDRACIAIFVAMAWRLVGHDGRRLAFALGQL